MLIELLALQLSKTARVSSWAENKTSLKHHLVHQKTPYITKQNIKSLIMHIKLIPTLGLMLPLFTAVAQANVEKTIFLAPIPAIVPSEQPDLDDLGLERLSPQKPVVRTQLNASFPTAAAPYGTDSWFFLENLNPGQRYEVRVCWLATVRQPTNPPSRSSSFTHVIHITVYKHN